MPADFSDLSAVKSCHCVSNPRAFGNGTGDHHDRGHRKQRPTQLKRQPLPARLRQAIADGADKPLEREAEGRRSQQRKPRTLNRAAARCQRLRRPGGAVHPQCPVGRRRDRGEHDQQVHAPASTRPERPAARARWSPRSRARSPRLGETAVRGDQRSGADRARPAASARRAFRQSRARARCPSRTGRRCR